MSGITVLAVYALLMLGVTAIFTKRARDAENFHVADRNLGTVVSAMSIAATWIWAPALFTSAEKAYANGIPGLFWFLVPNVACLLLFIPFGLFLPHLFQSQRRFGRFLLTSLVLLCCVECAQVLLLLGSCDIDDVILNLLGNVTGFVLWAMGHGIAGLFSHKEPAA